MITLWHNPRCSKSRETLALLTEAGHAPDIRLYLTTPPSADEITQVLTVLNLRPADLIRSGEALYKTLNLKGADDASLIAAMAAHPILIERPIVFAKGKAAIGRPPASALARLGL